MKQYIRDILIFLIVALRITAVHRFFMFKKGPLVRVVVFHDVANRQWFARCIEALIQKYNVITPLEFHSKTFDPQRINILLTFDDGYQTWMDNCLPVLEAYNRKGLFFINSGLLDIASDSDGVIEYVQNRLHISPKNPLTWEGARILVAHGHTIGGHTVTHPNLALLDTEEVQKEIIEDKQRIESILGISLQDFAYPFGRNVNWSIDTMHVAQEAGYSSIYTADTGYVDLTQSHTINRVCIEKDQPVRSIMWWIEGGYDIFKWHI